MLSCRGIVRSFGRAGVTAGRTSSSTSFCKDHFQISSHGLKCLGIPAGVFAGSDTRSAPSCVHWQSERSRCFAAMDVDGIMHSHYAVTRNGSSLYRSFSTLRSREVGRNTKRGRRQTNKPSMVKHKDKITATETSPSSAISQNITVNDSILKYIRMIGLGIPDKRTTKSDRKRKSIASTKIRTRHMVAGKVVLDERQERQLMVMQKSLPNHNRKWAASNRPRPQQMTSDGGRAAAYDAFLQPPPPFGRPSPNLSDSDDANTAMSRESIPSSTGQVRHIKRLPVKILGSVGSQTQPFPRGSKGLAEIAIAGRSNVGKSTLLNALLYGDGPSAQRSLDQSQRASGRRQRRTLASFKIPRGFKAATSSKPGETRSLTFYQLSSKVKHKQARDDATSKVSLLLVDLPGYGFAYAKESQHTEWQHLMKHYLTNRGKSLKRILLLVDARHGMKWADLQFLDTLQNALIETAASEHKKSFSGKDSELPKNKTKLVLPPIQIVLTKCDLVRQSDLARRAVSVRKELSDALIREPSALPIMMVSVKGEGQPGLLELQRELAALVPPPKSA